LLYSLRSEGSFCVNVQRFALTTAFCHWQLHMLGMVTVSFTPMLVQAGRCTDSCKQNKRMHACTVAMPDQCRAGVTSWNQTVVYNLNPTVCIAIAQLPPGAPNAAVMPTMSPVCLCMPLCVTFSRLSRLRCPAF
jgi:hypothetical protein